ncbi:hypothetical protein BBJ29_002449 [Phytophthora kernoviae]|uniref:Putative auto-transporter adhesin head GIN domain-containing protein n=1 Tax=Phytophthora kernoviae TaxID=325452 RepID=A0A3F2RPP0_9STRA|nr:hypothetical protein BBJ29_002449 [Phytophthora kernoviae]RLN61446.1 hypothetical protein BBP00_00005405 [Phytophthora kernoviae]
MQYAKQLVLRVTFTFDDVTSFNATPYWTVRCRPRGSLCDESHPYVVIVTGSHDVVLRYEAVSDNGDGDDLARVKVVDGKLSGDMAELMEINGLPVLQLSVTEGKLDVQLLRQQLVSKVVNQGSGTVTVESNVLVTSGPSLIVSAIGSGDVLVTSTSSVSVDYLGLTAQGSGQVQASFSDFHVKSMSMKVYLSGSTTAFVASSSAVDDLKLVVEGAGSMCLNSDSSLDTKELTISAIGSGDISLGPKGSCKDANLMMKLFSLYALVTFALSQALVDAAISIDSAESTGQDGAFLEKMWTVRGEDGDVIDALKVEVAGNVFVDYDASLHNSDGQVAAKVILRSSSADMVGLVDVSVLANNDEGSGFRVHYQNKNALAIGEVLTQIIVSDPSVLSRVSASTADKIVVGEGVLVSNDGSSNIKLATSGDSDIFIGSAQDAFALDRLVIASSGDGRVQFMASLIQANSIEFDLSGDGKTAVVATKRIIVDSITSSISGDGKVFVETADLQSQKLTATLSGDGKLAYSTAGSCVDQVIHLSGEGAVYAGPIICKNTFVTSTGDGKAMVQTTDTLTAVGHGSIKYVGEPEHIKTSTIFRKHSNVKQAKYNKVKTYSPRSPPTKTPTNLSVQLRAAWFGDSPHVRVHWGFRGPIVVETTGLANISGHSPHSIGPLGIVAVVGLLAGVAYHIRKVRARQEYAPLA